MIEAAMPGSLRRSREEIAVVIGMYAGLLWVRGNL